MAGNVACAVHVAAKLGSQAFGMFIKRQNQLQSQPLTGEEVSAFRKALAVCDGCGVIWQFSSYLEVLQSGMETMQVTLLRRTLASSP